jgi:hypothetical protein
MRCIHRAKGDMISFQYPGQPDQKDLYQNRTYTHLRHGNSAVCAPSFLHFPTISHYLQHRPTVTKSRRVAHNVSHEILE